MEQYSPFFTTIDEYDDISRNLMSHSENVIDYISHML